MSGSPSPVYAPSYILWSTHVVRDSWEVPLIWPMSWEKWIGTIALLMDAVCIVVLPMSRMHGVQQLDLGSIKVLPLD